MVIFPFFFTLLRLVHHCTSLCISCYTLFCTSVCTCLSQSFPYSPSHFADTPYRRLTNGIATTILFFASAATLRLSADGQRKRSRRGAQTAASASSRRLTRVRFAVCTLRFSLHSHKIIVFLSFCCHFWLFCYRFCCHFLSFFVTFLLLFCLFLPFSATFLPLSYHFRSFLVTLAEKRLKPALTELFNDVYDTIPKHLQEQEREMKEHIAKYPQEYATNVFAAEQIENRHAKAKPFLSSE